MSKVNIHGAEYPISKVFCDDFFFEVPLYQRPYAWTTEHAGELLEDLITFMDDGKRDVEELNPYFLGSIVLIKSDKPESQIVDGQQRLTTLTILLSALRATMQKSYAKKLTYFIYQEGNEITGTPNRYRLTIRERDNDFFKKYVQDEDGIESVLDINSAKLSDSQRNIVENSILYLDTLKKLSESDRLRLVQFIVNRCFLVVVSTPDLDSAYRIFSVLNDRGLDLSHTDILKAEVIGKISVPQQESYTKKWEDIEEQLGRELFQELFVHIRTIHRKVKLQDTILKEFRQYVKPAADPQHFINDVLIPNAEAFDIIKHASYPGNGAEEINNNLKWLNWIDNYDWIPPAITYLSLNGNRHRDFEKFLVYLERLAAGLMIQRANINKRNERYAKLLIAIENEEDLYTADSPLQLDNKERKDILKILNGDIYTIQKIRRYVLLRLDSALSEGEASYKFSETTIEHVLPQNPSPDSIWVQWFPNDKERLEYTHKIGNLVLLSTKKNIQAQNKDFNWKKEKYFITREKISPFVLTTQVIQEKDWTAEVIERRQKDLIKILKATWKL
jgi:hypothetical protein